MQSLSELKGKQISVPFGSTSHGMLLRAIRDLGWDPERDVIITSQAPEVGGTFLKTGKIDAHAEFVPFAELFPYRGFARKIYDGATVGVPTEHGVLVTGAFADKYPELVVAFLRAALEADRLVAANPEKLSELIQSVTGVEAEVDYMFHGPARHPDARLHHQAGDKAGAGDGCRHAEAAEEDRHHARPRNLDRRPLHPAGGARRGARLRRAAREL